MPRQKTIKKAVSFSGIGLHTGEQTTITFKPAPQDTGIVFIRADLPERPHIKADVSHVVDISRGTTIGLDGVKVLTVEHVLAAFAGLGIDNIFAELNASEAPVGDGSASPVVEVLMQAGIEEQGGARKVVKVAEPFAYEHNGVSIMALPSDRFELSYAIEYGHPALGSQFRSFPVEPKIFTVEIAPARTFCFLHDVEQMQALGLIKGGSIDNAVVIGDQDILNDSLRFNDEFVRHKLLDLLGDLSLFGSPLLAHIVAIKAGHASHVEFVKRLRSEIDPGHRADLSIPATGTNNVGTSLDVNQVREILPHRFPFLFVDRITSLNDRQVCGIKNVTISEPFFQGHIPGHPIMPGVLIIEAIAQVGAVLILSKAGHKGQLPYILGVEKAKFRRPVCPGDQMEIRVDVLKLHKKYGKLRGEVKVDGKLAAEAEIIFGAPE